MQLYRLTGQGIMLLVWTTVTKDGNILTVIYYYGVLLDILKFILSLLELFSFTLSIQ